MAHKTITISDKAYDALVESRMDNESFTKVILRLASKRGNASSLLEHLEGSPVDEELARNIEGALRKTRSARLRIVDLSS